MFPRLYEFVSQRAFMASRSPRLRLAVVPSRAGLLLPFVVVRVPRRLCRRLPRRVRVSRFA